MYTLNNGLNSGFDLDDIETNSGEELDKVLFDDLTPGQVPNLNENLEIRTLVNRFDDLNYLKQDIMRTGGMNRDFAMEAQALIPDFINEHRSAAFFTELFTKTQFTATLEAIDQEQKNITVKIKQLETNNLTA